MFSLLLVDDFGSQRTIMKMQTANFCIDYKEACNGEQALEILHENTIDGIITDVEMPKKNGIQMVKEIRSIPKYRNLPIMMISSASDKQNEAKRSGVTVWLNKPFDRKELLKNMESVFPNITASGKKDVIVINDTPDDLNILTRLLNEPGYNYRYAQTAMEGVRKFQKNPCDLFIKTDYENASVSGDKFVKKLRSKPQFKNVLILLLSNSNKSNFLQYGTDIDVISSQDLDLNKIKQKVYRLTSAKEAVSV